MSEEAAAPKIDKKSLAEKLDSIPSLPQVVYELTNVINNPMSSTKDIEDIMSKDIGLTTKVLALANSAYYAIPGGVSNLSRAIAFIGFDTIAQLVLSASIIKALEVKGPQEFDINEFWKHSIATGVSAEGIAKHIDHPNPPDLFTGGLIHDIGKIAFFMFEPEAFGEICKLTTEKGITYCQAEDELSYPSHIEIGGLLIEKWQLPRHFRLMVEYHHDLGGTKRGELSPDQTQMVDIVILANLLIHGLKFGNSGHKKILGAPVSLLERLKLKPEKDLPKILKSMKADLDKAAGLIKEIGPGT